MFAKLAEDLAELPALLEETRSYVARLLAGLDDRPVVAADGEHSVAELPEDGDGLRAQLAR